MEVVRKSTDPESWREIRLRAMACLIIFMLATDTFNPVKIFCSLTSLWPETISIISLGGLLFILWSNGSDFIYFITKIFFSSVLSIFFSSIEVLGKQNIPAHGPIIFTGNHMNQFVDAAILIATIPHKVGFLVAKKSFEKPIIGHFSKAVGSIPVARPQDAAYKGPGKVKFHGLHLYGEGTTFTKLKKGDKLRPGRTPDGHSFKTILSDTEIILQEVDPGLGMISPQEEPQDTWLTYDILPHVDQSELFSSVHRALARGENLGIFPEGGSHDRTDLLPLKVGIAVIAFGVLDKYDVNVPIVPVGLNYFRGHRFRGRVVIEFGTPFRINKDVLQAYQENKRKGYVKLLENVEEGMKSVIVPATDYNELKHLHTARRLYQTSATSFTTKQKQDLARRFTIGYHLLKLKYGCFNNETKHLLPADILEAEKKLAEYQAILDEWGLRDYQIECRLNQPFGSQLYTFLHGFVLALLASIPAIVLNAPVGLAARFWANREAKKDLKASRVKLAARDVVSSKKIVFSLVAVPILWVSYAIIAYFILGFSLRLVLSLFLCCPIFSYVGVMGVQYGMMDLKDLRPAYLRLLPAFKKIIEELPKKRAALQTEIRNIIRKYGPVLGEIYTTSDVVWDRVLRNVKALEREVMPKVQEEEDDEEDGNNVAMGLPTSASVLNLENAGPSVQAEEASVASASSLRSQSTQDSFQIISIPEAEDGEQERPEQDQLASPVDIDPEHDIETKKDK